MRAEELIGHINQPNFENRETLPELSALIEEYPYFQTAHVLFTQYLKAGKDSRFQTELRKTACYAGDRTKLFYLIENESFPSEKIAQLEKEDTNFNSPFDWINSFLTEKTSKTETPTKKPIEKQPVKSVEQVIEVPAVASTDYLSFLSVEKPETETKQETAPAATLQHQDVIDQFLQKDDIKIRFKKENETVPEEYPLDNELSSEEPNFLSLTLVKIYIRQKKYDKALENLQKLNLIYPEKNRYFADQIRFLEKLIHNTKK
ncbi:hypothetical protein FACS189413_09180 [Bacteroidia bacterium]|nr:hypothetical protein FACS189413_09180 [Bacteroidia bacterium]